MSPVGHELIQSQSNPSKLIASVQVLQFVHRHASLPTQLAGNSVYVDLAFLKRSMPRLAQCFHHRLVDVSSIAELARRWFPQDAKQVLSDVGITCNPPDLGNELHLSHRAQARQSPLLLCECKFKPTDIKWLVADLDSAMPSMIHSSCNNHQPQHA